MERVTQEFDLYAVREEHELLREAVRALAESKIAPRAAAVDETRRVPAGGATTRCTPPTWHAIHIPEEYGGAGADALATCIVIEEVARACASSSLIPAVNKLGTMPLLLSGSEELKRRYLTPVARRRGDVLLRPVRAGRGLRRGRHDDQGRARRRRLACSTASSAGSPTPASPSTTR